MPIAATGELPRLTRRAARDSSARVRRTQRVVLSPSAAGQLSPSPRIVEEPRARHRCLQPGQELFLLSPVVRWQAASRFWLRRYRAGRLSPFRGPGCILNATQVKHNRMSASTGALAGRRTAERARRERS